MVTIPDETAVNGSTTDSKTMVMTPRTASLDPAHQADCLVGRRPRQSRRGPERDEPEDLS